MNHRRDRCRLLGVAALLISMSLSIPARAAVSKGENYTNAVAAEQQRLLLFDQAERSYQKQLQVGRQRYEQKQTNRARVIAAMSSELQTRQQAVVIQPVSAPETNVNADQPLVPVRPSMPVAALAIALLGFASYLNRRRARNAQRPERPPRSEPQPPPAAVISLAEEIFFCRAVGAIGRGRYTEDGFLVLKGSIGCKKCAPVNTTETSRGEPFDSGLVREVGNSVVFEKDHLFSSPGKAATALLGRTVSGWVEWKTEDGTTLDTAQRLERKPLQ